MKSLFARILFVLVAVYFLISCAISEARGGELWLWQPFFAGEKWGWKDEKGKVVIKPQFDEVYAFSEGLGAARIGEKWGFIDQTGMFVIKPQFDEIYIFGFEDGIIAVKAAGKWGYINKWGIYTVEPQFEDVHHYTEGLAAVKVGGKWGYIDKIGKNVINPQFDESFDFSEGMAGACESAKCGYINKIVNYVINPQFDDVRQFSFAKLAAVKVGDKWGFINKKGRIVIDPKFDSPSIFFGGIAIVTIDGEGIDVTGKILGKDWKYCSSGEDGPFVYYNTKNISYPSQGIVKIWTKFAEAGEGHALYLNDIDCANKRVRMLSYTMYDKEGKVLNTVSNDADKSKWEYIVPDSLMEAISKAVCPKRK